MNKTFRKFTALVVVIALCGGMFITSCQTQKKSNDAKASAAVQQITSGIKSYIQEQNQGKDSLLSLQADSEQVHLKLLSVAKSAPKSLGNNQYFTTTKMLDTKDNLYEVDFFMNGKDSALKITKAAVEIKNGRPLYYWQSNTQNNTWTKVSVENAGDKLKGVLPGSADEYNFTYTVTLPKISGKAQIWIPIAQTNQFQQVNLLSVKSPKQGKYLTDSVFGNKALYLALDSSLSGKNIVISYHVKRKEKTAYAPTTTLDKNTQFYLQPDPLIPANAKFKNIADSVVKAANATGKVAQAHALYRYIRDNMSYIKYGTYGTGSAMRACRVGRGNCTEFHSYFIALARSINIPARYFIGFSIPSAKDGGNAGGYHCWAEFYAAGQWHPIDISEANKHPSLKDYYFGHNPANRFDISRGRNLHFNPGPNSETGGIKFFVYPVLQVNGKNVPVATSFSFKRTANAHTSVAAVTK